MKALMFVLLSLMAVAQDKPAAKPEVPEVAKLKIISAYKSALIVQQSLNTAKEDLCNNNPDCTRLRGEFQKAMMDYQTAVTEGSKGLPAGMALSVVLSQDATRQPLDVTVVQQQAQVPAPPKVEPKKDELKK